MFLRTISSALAILLAGAAVALGANPFPGKKSKWNGHERYDFTLEGRQATVVVPETPLEGNPWVWRPAFFDAFPSIDNTLLNEGFHIAYYDNTYEWGREEALESGQKFYELMVNECGMMPKAVMNGLSRGGYYSLLRGELYPNTVACMILDNPLVDIFELKRDAEWWNDVLDKYDLHDNPPQRGLFTQNAAYNIGKAAENGVPVLLLSGGNDTIVPYENNGRLVMAAYRRHGAPIKQIVRPEGGHHPHGLDRPEAIVPYIKSAVAGNAAKRGKLKVACIGNSITEGGGTSDPATKSYPAVLQNLLGDGYEVVNFGVSSSTALKKGTESGRPFGWINTDACRRAIEYAPDIVVLKLGGNDSKPDNWKYADEFEADYQDIIDTFKYLPSLPEIYICLPAKARCDDPSQIWGINEKVIIDEITPKIKKIAHANRLPTINLHDAYDGEEGSCYSDHIHPNDYGASLLAKKIASALLANP